MSQLEVLLEVIKKLSELEIDYMLTDAYFCSFAYSPMTYD